MNPLDLDASDKATILVTLVLVVLACLRVVEWLNVGRIDETTMSAFTSVIALWSLMVTGTVIAAKRTAKKAANGKT